MIITGMAHFESVAQKKLVEWYLSLIHILGIYTSRYSNKELADGKYYCVGISIGTPKFKLAYRLENQCYSLAPVSYTHLDVYKRQVLRNPVWRKPHFSN